MDYTLVLYLLLGLAVLGVGYYFFFAWLRRRVAMEANQALSTLESRNVLAVSAAAVFLGQEPAPAEAWSGNGTLVLTEKELYFQLDNRKHSLRVPLAATSAAEVTSVHAGRDRGKPLLKVSFTAEGGQEATAAFRVPRPQEWVAKVNQRLG